jgi:uncharacterized protein YecE (DUF72 family)
MTDLTILAGASGYSYKEWRGTFYPEKFAAEAMLRHYAERLPTVEINNTFYRLPKAEVVAAWAAETPPTFRFAIKASRRITHLARLKPETAADAVVFLYKNLAVLGSQRGPVLYQLPPFMKKDLARLEAFLALLPADHGAAFEFRNESWFTDDVYAALAKAGAALVLSEREDSKPPPIVATAPFGYARLRLEDYTDQDLKAWAKRLKGETWRTAYAYFMHEPTAPAYAAKLMRFAG